MASTYSELKFELIGTGDQSGTWGTTTNSNIGTAIQEAITGSADVTFSSADVTVTLTDTVAAQTARNLRLNLTGTTGGARNLILGSGCQIEKLYLINNGTADTVTVKNTSGTGIAVPAGKSMWVYNDGTNVVDAVTHLTSLTLGSALPVASGGTGATTLTANNVIIGNGTSAVQFVAPGSSGNVLTSNGTTWASSALPAGGLTYVYKTANYTTQDKEGVLTNTTGGAFTVTLPAAPATGAQVVVADAGAYWGTNNLTVGRNGSTIGDLAQDLVCDITGASVQLVYDGTTWEVYAQIGGNGGNAATQPGNNAFTGTNTFTGLNTFSGSTSVAATKLTNAKEVATISATAATGTINYDVTTQSVLYYTSNASANWTVNFRGSSGTSLNTLMSTGESMTVAFLVTQGSTAYYNSAVQVDGSSVTPKYQGGTAWSAGNASSIDAYVYTIVKTGAATFTVFASQTKFA